MKLDFKTVIEPADTLKIEQYIRRALIRSALPQYRSTIETIITPTLHESKPLSR